MHIFNTICDWVIQSAKVKDASECEIVRFGIMQGLFFLRDVCIFLLLGVLFNKSVQGIIFLMTFCPLRKFAGGFHADTRVKCFVISFFSMVVIYLALRPIESDIFIHVFLGVLCFIILKTAPVDNAHNRLSQDELNAYGKTIQRIEFIEVVVYLIACC